jgi:hypothetical protein
MAVGPICDHITVAGAEEEFVHEVGVVGEVAKHVLFAGVGAMAEAVELVEKIAFGDRVVEVRAMQRAQDRDQLMVPRAAPSLVIQVLGELSLRPIIDTINEPCTRGRTPWPLWATPDG